MRGNLDDRSLKLNKNNFPLLVNTVIKDQSSTREEKNQLIRQELKSWYQQCFQKNNRWNRAQLIKHVNDYSVQELDKLGQCFELLFNMDNQYYLVFIKYLNEYQTQKDIAKSILGTSKLTVNQKTFEEIINYFGDLKRVDKLQNTNKQIAISGKNKFNLIGKSKIV